MPFQLGRFPIKADAASLRETTDFQDRTAVPSYSAKAPGATPSRTAQLPLDADELVFAFDWQTALMQVLLVAAVIVVVLLLLRPVTTRFNRWRRGLSSKRA